MQELYDVFEIVCAEEGLALTVRSTPAAALFMARMTLGSFRIWLSEMVPDCDPRMLLIDGKRPVVKQAMATLWALGLQPGSEIQAKWNGDTLSHDAVEVLEVRSVVEPPPPALGSESSSHESSGSAMKRWLQVARRVGTTTGWQQVGKLRSVQRLEPGMQPSQPHWQQNGNWALAGSREETRPLNVTTTAFGNLSNPKHRRFQPAREQLLPPALPHVAGKLSTDMPAVFHEPRFSRDAMMEQRGNAPPTLRQAAIQPQLLKSGTALLRQEGSSSTLPVEQSSAVLHSAQGPNQQAPIAIARNEWQQVLAGATVTGHDESAARAGQPTHSVTSVDIAPPAPLPCLNLVPPDTTSVAALGRALQTNPEVAALAVRDSASPGERGTNQQPPSRTSGLWKGAAQSLQRHKQEANENWELLLRAAKAQKIAAKLALEASTLENQMTAEREQELDWIDKESISTEASQSSHMPVPVCGSPLAAAVPPNWPRQEQFDEAESETAIEGASSANASPETYAEEVTPLVSPCSDERLCIAPGMPPWTVSTAHLMQQAKGSEPIRRVVLEPHDATAGLRHLQKLKAVSSGFSAPPQPRQPRQLQGLLSLQRMGSPARWHTHPTAVPAMANPGELPVSPANHLAPIGAAQRQLPSAALLVISPDAAVSAIARILRLPRPEGAKQRTGVAVPAAQASKGEVVPHPPESVSSYDNIEWPFHDDSSVRCASAAYNSLGGDEQHGASPTQRIRESPAPVAATIASVAVSRITPPLTQRILEANDDPSAGERSRPPPPPISCPVSPPAPAQTLDPVDFSAASSGRETDAHRAPANTTTSVPDNPQAGLASTPGSSAVHVAGAPHDRPPIVLASASPERRRQVREGFKRAKLIAGRKTIQLQQSTAPATTDGNQPQPQPSLALGGVAQAPRLQPLQPWRKTIISRRAVRHAGTVHQQVRYVKSPPENVVESTRQELLGPPAPIYPIQADPAHSPALHEVPQLGAAKATHHDAAVSQSCSAPGTAEVANHDSSAARSCSARESVAVASRTAAADYPPQVPCCVSAPISRHEVAKTKLRACLTGTRSKSTRLLGHAATVIESVVFADAGTAIPTAAWLTIQGPVENRGRMSLQGDVASTAGSWPLFVHCTELQARMLGWKGRGVAGSKVMLRVALRLPSDATATLQKPCQLELSSLHKLGQLAGGSHWE